MSVVRWSVVLLVCVILGISRVQSAPDYVPVVVMHGISAQASDMDELLGWINSTYPGIYTRSVEVGDGSHDSMHMPMQEQVQAFCDAVSPAKDPRLARGFHLLGYSQGSLVTRGFIEKCDNEHRVKRYVTLGGVHEGVFSAPYVSFLPSEIWNVLSTVVYEDWMQQSYSFAGYWKDPAQYDKYLAKASYLPDINNEGPTKNPQYRENMIALEMFVMVKSTGDKVVFPVESGWFEFWQAAQSAAKVQDLQFGVADRQVVPLQESETYKGDWIGLKTLDEAGKLKFLTASCTHPDYPHTPDKDWFMANIMPLFGTSF
eukprot:ANDGO_07859.mRNA.1 Palmitoyl-protein thioesterase 3